MVRVTEGGDPQKVPLVHYDEEGNRTVIGEAAVQIANGEVIALGQLSNTEIGLSISSIGIESFSMSLNPSPVEEASARLGILRKSRRDHVTDRNPSGEVNYCGRTGDHHSHEWRKHPADIFAVYCPGKSKS